MLLSEDLHSAGLIYDPTAVFSDFMELVLLRAAVFRTGAECCGGT